MAIIRCAGEAVIALRMTLPVSGKWVATLDVDTDQALSGPVVLEDEGVTYAGSVSRSGVVAFGCRATVVGGAGGLGKRVPSRSYNGVTARVVVSELLTAVGERLDATSTTAFLATPLTSWTRADGQASHALQTLCDRLGGRWRVLPSGAVWVGVEAWPKAPRNFEAVELDRDPAAGSVLFAPDAITLRPGYLFRSDRIGRVEHAFDRDAPLRTTAWIES